MLRTAITSAFVYLAVSAPALAGWREWRDRFWPRNSPETPASPAHQVPEIDASSGLLAVAAVATVLLYVWERRRQATK